MAGTSGACRERRLEAANAINEVMAAGIPQEAEGAEIYRIRMIFITPIIL